MTVPEGHVSAADQLLGDIDGTKRVELDAVAAGFGVYVHIPFCSTKCEYCAFATWTGRANEIDLYVEMLCREIDAARCQPFWRTPDTVFFGGGTPSLLSVSQIATILRHLEASPYAEITMECNPESTHRDLLVGAADAGVNRISLGVQSMRSHVTASLGRHTETGALERALAAITAAGIGNFSVDLVYGAVGESTADFVGSLEEVLSLGPRPTHVSAYALTVEPGTPLAHQIDRHPDDDCQAERYERADAILRHHGFEWYEISNWSLDGFQCRHNLSCWLGGEYLGVGCAAHSHIDGERFANIRSLDRYVEAIRRSSSPVATRQRVSADDRIHELLELSLRTRVGVPDEAICRSAADDGLVSVRHHRAVLTVRGRLLANEAMLRLRPPALPERHRSSMSAVGLRPAGGPE